MPGPNEVLEVLAPGRYVVEFSHVLGSGDVPPVRREVVVKPGALVDLEVEMPALD